MTLTGIEILHKGRWQFVGKVGRCPAGFPDPRFVNQIIFYREEPYTKTVSSKLNALSFDASAWDAALKLGAVGVVVYCHDVGRFILVSHTAIKAVSRSDLGGQVQVRVPLSKCTQYHSAKPLQMGYTTVIKRIREEEKTTDDGQISQIPDMSLSISSQQQEAALSLVSGQTGWIIKVTPDRKLLVNPELEINDAALKFLQVVRSAINLPVDDSISNELKKSLLEFRAIVKTSFPTLAGKSYPEMLANVGLLLEQLKEKK